MTTTPRNFRGPSSGACMLAFQASGAAQASEPRPPGAFLWLDCTLADQSGHIDQQWCQTAHR